MQVTRDLIDAVRSGQVGGNTWKQKRSEFRLARRLYWHALLDRSMYGQDACEQCDDATGFICADHEVKVMRDETVDYGASEVAHAQTAVQVFSFTQTVCGRLEKTGSRSLVPASRATCKNCRYRIEQLELISGAKVTNVKTCEVTK